MLSITWVRSEFDSVLYLLLKLTFDICIRISRKDIQKDLHLSILLVRFSEDSDLENKNNIRNENVNKIKKIQIHACVAKRLFCTINVGPD